MRWERFFDGLDDEWEGERDRQAAADRSDRERQRLAALSLHARLSALAGTPAAIALPAGATVSGRVRARGVDWALVSAADGEWIVRIAAIRRIVVTPAAAVAALVPAPDDIVVERLGFGFLARDCAARRLPVRVLTRAGETLTGTIDRAGADHLDLAQHAEDEQRMSTGVTAVALLPFDAISALRLARGARPAFLASVLL